MGFNFTGLKPESEKGKRFQVNNKGWNALIDVLNECEDTGDVADEMEQDPDIAFVDADDCAIVADALEAELSTLFNKQTKEYEPLVKEFIEFCRVCGGFEIC